jgi:aminoglycoside 3-N-acetyltransferase
MNFLAQLRIQPFSDPDVNQAVLDRILRSVCTGQAFVLSSIERSELEVSATTVLTELKPAQWQKGILHFFLSFWVLRKRHVVNAIQQSRSMKSLKVLAKKYIKSIRRMTLNHFRPFTPDDFERALERVGVCPGDTLLVHSSFDAFEGFQEKPSRVISVLKNVVGAHGMLMMPTMTFSGLAVDHVRKNPLFDVVRTPSRMGLITELFRRSPGVVRSVHPTHPVAIWGLEANSVAAGHYQARTPCGAGTPFEALLERRGKIILLGADISVMTFFHMLEERFEHELNVAPFTSEIFHLRSKTGDGQILETHCRLFDPAASRRRNLYKMIPIMKELQAWRESWVGNLKITALNAADVESAVRRMNKLGLNCYD